MSSYELDRQENIRRNRALIKELGLNHTKQSSTIKQPARKRRKLSGSAPTRSSARIASAPKPDYATRPLPSSPPLSGVSLNLLRVNDTKLQDAPVTSPSPPPDIDSLIGSWARWAPSAPLPKRDEESGSLHFPSHPTFTPNKTPAEVLREGAFGGCYYRPYMSLKLRTTIRDDWKELPGEWIDGLTVDRYLTGGEEGVYDPEVNKFGVKAGQGLEDWERAGWIDHRFDARGWFQWYTRFYMGRRCEDDDRQVGRWERCVGKKGRWKRTLLKQYLTRGIRSVNDEEGGEGGEGGAEVSPVISQTCLQWAYEVKQDELDMIWSIGLA